MSPIATEARIKQSGIAGLVEISPEYFDRVFVAQAKHVSGISNPEKEGDLYVLVKGDMGKVVVDLKDGRAYGAVIGKGMRPGASMQRYDNGTFNPFSTQNDMTDVPDLEIKVEKILSANKDVIMKVLGRAQ